MKTIICLSLLLLTSCSYLQPLMKLDGVEEVVEDASEVVVEEAAALVGQPVDVEVDLNPATHPKCHHCPLHCPSAK